MLVPQLTSGLALSGKGIALVGDAAMTQRADVGQPLTAGSQGVNTGFLTAPGG